MKKILTRSGITLIIIPLFTVSVQWLIRYICKEDFNTIGITLGALGLGQLFPFFYFDHFIANKILSVKPNHKFVNEKMIIEYSLQAKFEFDEKKIELTKSLFTFVILVSLLIFFITIYLGIQGYIVLHIFLGSLICFSSWYLLIFRND